MVRTSWQVSTVGRWRLAVLTGDFRFGTVVIPFALMPHPRWSELLLPATQQLPPPLLAAVIAHHLDPITQALAQLTETTPQIAAWPSLETTAVACPLEVRMLVGKDEVAAFDFLLEVGHADAAEWLEPLCGRSRRTRATTPNAWRLPLSIEIGYASLKPEELKTLDVADVLVLEPVAATIERSEGIGAVLRVGMQAIGRGHLGPAGLSIAILFNPPREISMNNSEPSADSAKSLATQLHLRVRVVLDGGEFALGEIANWTAGTHLPLSTTLDSERIRLEVGDRVIARGRLIAIDQQFGLEVVETYA